MTIKTPALVPPRVAVLLYGLLREYKATTPSLMRHVVVPNDASIFYYGPAETDSPNSGHKGRNDIFDSMVNNPKSKIDPMLSINTADLREVYGARLQAAVFHVEPQSRFIGESEIVCERADWLFQMNPARMFSMFYNLQGVARMYLAHEQLTGDRHDTLILTRPDLAYYGKLTTHRGLPVVRTGEIHIPDGEGFSEWGEKHIGNAPVLHYKNLMTGDFVPGGRHVRFNDQIMMINRKDLKLFASIYDSLAEYMRARVPASPETVLYLHLMGRGGLTQHLHADWLYEIYRAGARQVQNLTDTSEIALIDRRHPAGVAFRNKNRLSAGLRDIKQLWRKMMWRLRR